MSLSAARVIGAQKVLTQLCAADSGRTEVHVINVSGVEMDIYLGTQTSITETVPPSPVGKNRLNLSGDSAKYAVSGLCRQAPLAADVTILP